jgi:O-antigen/teichoic acid export membrane protein
LGKVAAILMLPLYTHYLSTADYGVLELVELTLDLISIVAGSRLGAGVFRLYHQAADDAEKRTVISSAFVVLAAAFVAAGLIAWVGAPQIARSLLGGEEHTVLVRLAAISAALQSLLLIPMAELQLRERSRSLVAIGLGKLVVQLSLNIIFLVHFGWGMRGLLLATLIANVATGVPLALIFLRRFGIVVSGEAVKGILRLGIPFIGVQLARFFMTFGDRYFLRALQGTAAVGVYSLGYKFGFLLFQIGCGPFLTAWEPKRFELEKRADRDDIFNRVFLFMNLVLVTAAVVISLFVSDFLRIATTPEFHAAARVVPVILIAYIAQAWFSFHNYGLVAAGRTEYITLANWAAALIALGGYALLIPRWAEMGAAWATLLSFVASEWLLYALAQRVHRVAYQWTRVGRLSVIAGGVSTAALLLPRLPLVLSIAVHTIFLSIYAVLVWTSGVITASDRERLRGLRFSPASLVAALVR